MSGDFDYMQMGEDIKRKFKEITAINVLPPVAAMQKPDSSTPKCCGHPMQKSALKPAQRYCTWCRTYKPA